MKSISKISQYILAGIIFVVAIVALLLFTTDNPRYDLIFKDSQILLQALGTTLFISAITLALSIIFGFILFLLMKSNIPFIKAMAVIFREVIMGTPLLVMVFLGVYVFGSIFNLSDKLTLGIASLTLYMSPYLANSFETALAVVDKDQFTVMNLYHFNTWQKYRYIILPQMIKPIIPSIINNLSSIVKGSALLKVVSVSEISYIITVISSKNWATIEGYYVMWLSYLIITIPLSLLAQYLGRKLSR